jgi:hypothetical protein
MKLPMNKLRSLAIAGAAVTLLGGCAMLAGHTGPMSFFVTSAGTGKGADLGGLAGADAHCQRLAAAAGAGGKTWRAYLSTPMVSASGTTPAAAAVNARDRIGSGPWYNAKGVMIARSLEHLHNGNNINGQTGLDERGQAVPGRSSTPIEHDMLTGSRADGTALAPHTDTTCKAWTSSTDGSAIVGHYDREGPDSNAWSTSWNFSHQTAGCSVQGLIARGGAGRFYCFAAN